MTTDALTIFADDPRLPQLAALLHRPSPFNILGVLGLSRQELRHSDLLAYLLAPRQTHGLSDRFARALLTRAAPLLSEALEVTTLDLDGMTVQREWGFIDILLESPADRLAIIVENKVDSGEHSDQLGRYYQLVRKHRPGWRIIGMFLTLDGSAPARQYDREHYVPLGYLDVAAALGELAQDVDTQPDVRTLLRHYAQLIRSVLVPDQDSDQARLARQLYSQHRETFDAMSRARDARMNMIQRAFQELFAETERTHPEMLSLDRPFVDKEQTRWHNRFAPPEWYRKDLEVSTPWTRTRLVLVFEAMHAPQQIHLGLTVGPAPGAEAIRRALFDLAQRRVTPLYPAWNRPDDKWFSIYAHDIYPYGSDYFAEASDETIRRTLREHWLDFIHRDLPAIRATIRHEILGRTW